MNNLSATACPSAITSTAQSTEVTNSFNSSNIDSNMDWLFNNQMSFYQESQTNQYIMNELRRLNDRIYKIEEYMHRYSEHIIKLDKFINEHIINNKPKVQMINVPQDEYMVTRMKLDAEFIISLIQENEFFRTVIIMIRKANVSDVPLQESKEMMDLTMFSESINLKHIKFNKGHKANNIYLLHSNLKLKFWQIIRKTWENSGLFDQHNPKQMKEEYKHFDHNKCLTTISNMISTVCFNNCHYLWQKKLLTSRGNII